MARAKLAKITDVVVGLILTGIVVTLFPTRLDFSFLPHARFSRLRLRLQGVAQTRRRAIRGTPNHVAREQIAGQKVVGRSDLFSLAIVLFELPTGGRPFRGDSLATIHPITRGEPVPSARLAPGAAAGRAARSAQSAAQASGRAVPDGGAVRRGAAPGPRPGPGADSVTPPHLRPMWVQAAGRTDVGRRRANNEDHHLADEGLGLFVVADGLGGHASGEVASRLCVDSIREQLAGLAAGGGPPPALGPPVEGVSDAANHLANSIRVANQVIYGAATARPEYRGMATTVVVALVVGGRIAVAHVGDSRTYRLRAGKLEQLSRDHSLVAEQVALGLLTEAEALASPQRYVVTRAVGTEPTVRVDVVEHPIRAGDTLLLCSDGLSDMVDEGTIVEVVAGAGEDLEAACGALVEQANRRGGEDNITAVLARFADGGARRPGLWRRLRGADRP